MAAVKKAVGAAPAGDDGADARAHAGSGEYANALILSASYVLIRLVVVFEIHCVTLESRNK